MRWVRSDQPADEYVLGNWDTALSAAEGFIREVEVGSPHYGATASYATRALVRLGRDDSDGARADAERTLEIARLSGDPQNVFPWLAACAHVFHEIGDTPTAAALAMEFLAELKRSGTVMVALDHQHELAWTLAAVGRGAELLEALPTFDSPWAHAASAFASGDLAGAAELCAAMGAASQEARVRLWLAERLLTAGRHAEGVAELTRARGFYTTVRAARYLRVADVLLARTPELVRRACPDRDYDPGVGMTGPPPFRPLSLPFRWYATKHPRRAGSHISGRRAGVSGEAR